MLIYAYLLGPAQRPSPREFQTNMQQTRVVGRCRKELPKTREVRIFVS